MTITQLSWGCLAVALGLATATPASAAPRKIDFNRDIRPILSDNCYACHGPDEKARKSKLRLDTAEGALAKHGSSAAIIPRDLKKSELWARVTTKDANDVMPPPESKKKPLTPAQLALLKQWIEEGANYQGHWSFVAPVKSKAPEIRNSQFAIRNAIDSFIAAKLAERKLTPNPEAPREVLIRRVTFDLTGLPPTPAEVDAFLADKSPNAYEKVVDRVLKSPHYGEHMGRHWLDAARYGDTHGMHLDNERSMWPYRDWVVRAFNRNLPFDQFTIEQLAGDLLPSPTQDQLIATGFNRCNVTTGEGGSINEEWIFRYAVDRTETAASVWMGLTAGCAVCHDHKYDPITAKDFYSMYAFFHSNADPAMDGNALLTAPILKLTSPEQQKKLDDFNTQIAGVDKRIKAELTKVVYTDPSTLNPPPPLKKFDTTWVDDDFPAGAKVEASGASTTAKWVTTQDGKVLAGKRALKRTDPGVGQDFFSELKTPFTIPPNGKVFLNVLLDPQNPPKAVMLQFNTGNWSHRAVWGDIYAIDFGKKDTNERKRLGDLPKAGEWVKLEFAASQLGFKAGDKIMGLAFTLAGGTVTWDQVGITGESNPAKDPNESLAVWLKENQGKTLANVPDDVKRLFRSVKPEDRKPEETKRLHEYYFELVCNTTRPQFEKLHAEKNPIAKARDDFDKAIPATFIWKDLEKPRDSFVMVRGQYNKPGQQVWPNVPAVLPPLPKSGTTNRLDFAKWLVSPQHPLTARVAVNRFWQQLFGTGLVKTAADFGAQGEAPSHPELLDWLAVTFREQSWDMKQFMKLLVTSATYRQDSKATPQKIAADPENRFYSRGPRFRLDAEQVRDNALAVSGLLVPTIGGKGVRTYQPDNIWEPVAYSGSNTKTYKRDGGDALWRRSLYTFIKRTAPAPSMTTFDAPSREQSCARRERSNTPLQALLLMNDVQHFEAARAFAQRIMKEGGSHAEERLAYGFRLATARPPTKAELAVLSETLFTQWAKYQGRTDAAKKAITFGESKPDASLDPSELAAYAMLANLILNLDEVVTKN
ncbi:MAG: hypothetical protein B9S33_12870 [Pedosphaera sp. Tous-C6FEB]|nr:MAG: hypothetical protein B9S33_12870 [Pedosphaera sp. Tous-C6FEB]